LSCATRTRLYNVAQRWCRRHESTKNQRGTIAWRRGHKRMSLRVLAILGASAVVHIGALAAGFYLQAHEPVAPEPKTVTVLSGHVDSTGNLELSGWKTAKLK
jgi:hypothetical protein